MTQHRLSLAVLFGLGILAACATTRHGSDRNPASSPVNYGADIAALQKIPLVPGSESRNDAAEAKVKATLIDLFTQMQAEAKYNGAAGRATHHKGSCFSGKMTVLSSTELKTTYGYSDAIISRLKRGIYSPEDGTAYDAQIRFANGQGTYNPDTVGDVRGLSFSLNLGNAYQDAAGTSRQDFMSNNTPPFATKDITDFMEFIKATFAASHPKEAIKYIPDPLYAVQVAEAIALFEAYQRTDAKSYATEWYWANVPYTQGLNPDGSAQDVVKVKLIPCGQASDQTGDVTHIVRESSAGKAPDYLQTDIATQATNGNVCFDLQLQFFDYNTMSSQHPTWSRTDWIENGGIVWDETLLKFYSVARLTIPAGNNTLSSDVCESWFTNPRLHSVAQHRPIGSIARVRAEVEENSRHLRQGQ